jgi:hypothetical protein
MPATSGGGAITPVGKTRGTVGADTGISSGGGSTTATNWGEFSGLKLVADMGTAGAIGFHARM